MKTKLFEPSLWQPREDRPACLSPHIDYFKYDASIPYKEWKRQIAVAKIQRRSSPEVQISVEVMCYAIAAFRDIDAPSDRGATARAWQELGWWGAFCNLWTNIAKSDSWIIKQYSKVQGFQNIAFPLIRRVYPNLIANELVQVQPMTMPSSALFFMDYRYGDGDKDK